MISISKDLTTEEQVAVQNLVAKKPDNSTSYLWIIGGVFGSVIVLCLSIILVLFGAKTINLLREKTPIEAVLDSVMKDMDAKNAESAYSLFSPLAKTELSLNNLQEKIDGDDYVLFAGYQSLKVYELNLAKNENKLNVFTIGDIVNVKGEILYSGGITGQFYAELQKVDGNWKLHLININVPPEKHLP